MSTWTCQATSFVVCRSKSWLNLSLWLINSHTKTRPSSLWRWVWVTQLVANLERSPTLAKSVLWLGDSKLQKAFPFFRCIIALNMEATRNVEGQGSEGNIKVLLERFWSFRMQFTRLTSEKAAQNCRSGWHKTENVTGCCTSDNTKNKPKICSELSLLLL